MQKIRFLPRTCCSRAPLTQPRADILPLKPRERSPGEASTEQTGEGA